MYTSKENSILTLNRKEAVLVYDHATSKTWKESRNGMGWKTIQYCNYVICLYSRDLVFASILLHVRSTMTRKDRGRLVITWDFYTRLRSPRRYNELFKRKWHLGFYESAIFLWWVDATRSNPYTLSTIFILKRKILYFLKQVEMSRSPSRNNWFALIRDWGRIKNLI